MSDHLDLIRQLDLGGLKENEVGMSLRGRPRWWTHPGGGEIIRIDFTNDRDVGAKFREAKLDPTAWVVLPTGAMKWPPLVGAFFVMGDEGLRQVTEDMKGRWFPGDSPVGRALELRLVGMGR